MYSMRTTISRLQNCCSSSSRWFSWWMYSCTARCGRKLQAQSAAGAVRRRAGGCRPPLSRSARHACELLSQQQLLRAAGARSGLRSRTCSSSSDTSCSPLSSLIRKQLGCGSVRQGWRWSAAWAAACAAGVCTLACGSPGSAALRLLERTRRCAAGWRLCCCRLQPAPLTLTAVLLYFMCSVMGRRVLVPPPTWLN